MMRLILLPFVFFVGSVGIYMLIRLHARLIVKWKNFIERTETEGTDFLADDDELHSFMMLLGATMVPLTVDFIFVAILYMFFQDIFL